MLKQWKDYYHNVFGKALLHQYIKSTVVLAGLQTENKLRTLFQLAGIAIRLSDWNHPIGTKHCTFNSFTCQFILREETLPPKAVLNRNIVVSAKE